MDWRSHVRLALRGEHPVLGRSVLFVLYGLIIVSTISIGVSTLPQLSSGMRRLLRLAEIIIVAVFSAEYILRIAVADNRLAYIRSFWGIVDLLAILPFYLSMGLDLRAVRAARLLRLFRLFKLVRYSNAIDRITAAFNMVREELAVFGLVAIFTLYLCAIGIYHFEHAAQPEQFASVFHSIWWAAVTLTTVGYGDIYPVTLGGRVFTVAMLFVALGVIAVPTGLMSSALSRIRDRESPKE